jgi:Spy/CpxP family protein refolding chaperone
VLDLAAQLGLSAQQRGAAEAVFAAMSARARSLGGDIVQHERELDAAFSARAIDARTLARLTGQIARLQGELRAVHLQAHLELRHLLTDEQVAAYERLRGYEAR